MVKVVVRYYGIWKVLVDSTFFQERFNATILCVSSTVPSLSCVL